MIHFKRLVASLLIVSTAAMGLPMTAQASIVGTDEVSAATAPGAPAPSATRERLSSWLARDDVRQALQERGISPQEAADRVQALSDDEVAQLAGRVDQAPAGGDVLGVLFTVFIILLVTDIMGLTKVFPFTRSVR